MIFCDQKATIDRYVIATKVKQIHVWEPLMHPHVLWETQF